MSERSSRSVMKRLWPDQGDIYNLDARCSERHNGEEEEEGSLSCLERTMDQS